MGLPPIGRMRGRRLYAADGRRYLDLRFDDGRGFVGAKGIRAGTWAKNGIERGLTQPAPSVHEARLKKAILALVPGSVAVSLFENAERALAALERLSGSKAILDPVRRHVDSIPGDTSGVPGDASGAAAIWRPFVPAAAGAIITLVVTPCPRPFGPTALAFADAALAERERGDELPPIMPLVALRALADLDRLAVGIPGNPKRDAPVTAATYAESFWKRADKRLAPHFERRGPYLYARCDLGAWPRFRESALEAGCVLTPDWELPSIVPYEYDDGELKKLAAALASLAEVDR